MNSENITYMYAPKGEWWDSFLESLAAARISYLQTATKSYELLLKDMPITIEACRSKDVLAGIDDQDTLAWAGITGSDVYIEQKLNGYYPGSYFDQDELPTPNYQTQPVPLYSLAPDSPQPRLYLGSTPRARGASSSPTIEDLSGKSIYTAYPNITSRLFGRRGINALPVNIKERAGGIEGKWITDPTAYGVVDIIDSGETALDNLIEVMQFLMQAQLIFVVSNEIRPRDMERINDLQEELYIASRRNKND